MMQRQMQMQMQSQSQSQSQMPMQMQMLTHTLMQEHATFANCPMHQHLSCYATSATRDIIHTVCSLPSPPFPRDNGYAHHALTVSSK
jgi:hypothetical protein